MLFYFPFLNLKVVTGVVFDFPILNLKVVTGVVFDFPILNLKVVTGVVFDFPFLNLTIVPRAYLLDTPTQNVTDVSSVGFNTVPPKTSQLFPVLALIPSHPKLHSCFQCCL